MATPANDLDLRIRMRRLEGLLHDIEEHADPAVQARIREIVQTLLEYHGAGLARLLAYLAETGEAGQALLNALAADELVSSLLLLYGLHPHDLETRVCRALDKLGPYLESRGGQVELVGVAEGVVRLRMQGSWHGFPSSAQMLKQFIEEAIYEAAPDVAALEVEGLTEPPARLAATFVPVEQLTLRRSRLNEQVKQ